MKQLLLKKYIFAPLKFIAFILSAYVILCSVIPCCIIDDCNMELQTKTSKTDSHDDCKGNCSPFFACGNCAGFSIDQQEFQTTTVNIIGKKSYPEIYSAFFSNYTSSVWQPPKSC